jgi:7-carboxy-7-deazaguanine synthase
VSYKIKEVFYSIQGEGSKVGQPVVFCRFSGCNLWSGRAEDRANAVCKFCDTDFWGTNGMGGGNYNSADDVVTAVEAEWASDQGSENRWVVCTGGEPLLQLDEKLIEEFHARRFKVAVETNGTLLPPHGIDHVCVSPKASTTLRITCGHELKLVFPQPGAEPERYEHLDFQHFFIQPMDDFQKDQNTSLAVSYCLKNPKWRLSLQIHKYIGIP